MRLLAAALPDGVAGCIVLCPERRRSAVPEPAAGTLHQHRSQHSVQTARAIKCTPALLHQMQLDQRLAPAAGCW